MSARPCYLHSHAGEELMNMLVADIGGTQSRFFMFYGEDREISIKEGVVLSSLYPSFEALLEKIYASWPEGGKKLREISLLVFAAAGPVKDGRIAMTNASFVVDAAVAKACFPNVRCLVMNDFEAQAWACLTPVMRECVSILSGRLGDHAVPSESLKQLSGLGNGRSPVAVVGAGTGLGAAWLIPDSGCGRPFVLPSEAGHTAFPFDVDGEEQAFLNFLHERHHGGPVTAEHVLSGPGLALLYEYMYGRPGDPARFTQDPGFADSACCRLFAGFYGRFCRMTALALLPQMLVITGGVAGKTPALVLHPAFSREFFRAEGEQLEFLKSMPVWLNRHPQAGLWGAARAGVAFAEGR